MEQNNRINGHLVIVMAIEHYNPLSMIRSFGKNGIYPVYIAIKGKGKIASSSKFVGECHYVDSIEEAFSCLKENYGNEKERPFVLCTDDKTISYLDLHYSEIKDSFSFFNAGKNGRINQYMNKFEILKLAEKHGLSVLKTVCVENGTIPADLEYPVITKSISPVKGGWKSDVHICNSAAELAEAYKTIRSPQVVIQKYLDKKNEYTLEGFSIDHGKDSYFSISVTYNYLIKGYYSPYITIKNADKEEINEKVAAMLKEIGFEGIFEIEFLVGHDGMLYFEEINFRNSPWSYPSSALGKPVPELWIRSMLNGHIDHDYAVVPEKYTAMIEPVDYGKRVETGMISEAEWLYDYKDTDVTFYFDADDPEPFFLMMKNREFYS